MEAKVNIQHETERLVQQIAQLLEEQNMYQYEVIDLLVDKGMEKETATQLVEKVAELIEENKSKGAWKSIVIGSIMTIAGVLLTVFLFTQGWLVGLTIALAIAGGSTLFKGINNLNI